MKELLVVGAGGFLGAVARYVVSAWVERLGGGGFPYGTLTVNVLGCLAIGAVLAAFEDHAMVRFFVVLGFLGSLTTFSTFGHETVALLRGEQVMAALLSVAANVVLGVAAVIAGRAAVISMVQG